MKMIYCNSYLKSFDSLESPKYVDPYKIIELSFFDTDLMNEFLSEFSDIVYFSYTPHISCSGNITYDIMEPSVQIIVSKSNFDEIIDKIKLFLKKFNCCLIGDKIN